MLVSLRRARRWLTVPNPPRALSSMPPQIQRLLLLTVFIVAAYGAARATLKPRSFGELGWYRGAALKELSSLPTVYAGKAECAGCHGPVLEKMAPSKHQGVSCEACHGPCAVHLENPAELPAKIANPRFCLRCHAASPSRPAQFPQIDPAEHFRDSTCLECHSPHAPAEAPAK